MSALAGLFWRRPYALLLLAPLAWAGNLLIGRAYGETLPPFSLALTAQNRFASISAPFAEATRRCRAPR